MGQKKGSVLARARNAAKASAARILQTSTGTSNPVSHSPDNLPIHNSLDRADDSTDLNDIINNFVALEEEGLAPEYDERVEDELEVDKNIGESALQAFGLFLQRAQAEATAREHASKKRQRGSYKGNTPRTKFHHAAKCRKFVAEGGKLITNWFGKVTPSEYESGPDIEEIPTPLAQPEVPKIPEQNETVDWEKLADPAEACARLNALFNELKDLENHAEIPTKSDAALNALHSKDWPALHKAAEALTLRSRDKKIGVVLHTQISAMLGALNLYLDQYTKFTWKQASFLAARSQGKSVSHAQRIR
ncbi:hypothetical protein BDP27DRAFT_1467596 [Rhodocollybia butyracea]|uniref:Uncharacterized protein n=1 Tax=Rhodocollybia butyracea TaxID=206335 RepID=A0A9P5U4L2_9AGAR|nr:hypothetical protein BDP27DRAFT_1467596 [Rhodocollybia butyracea]